jgi:hypothetical protein
VAISCIFPREIDPGQRDAFHQQVTKDMPTAGKVTKDTVAGAHCARLMKSILEVPKVNKRTSFCKSRNKRESGAAQVPRAAAGMRFF